MRILEQEYSRAITKLGNAVMQIELDILKNTIPIDNNHKKDLIIHAQQLSENLRHQDIMQIRNHFIALRGILKTSKYTWDPDAIAYWINQISEIKLILAYQGIYEKTTYPDATD